MKEIEMCTEEDMITTARSGRRQSRVSKDVTVIEPIQSKRDLFAEDADNDLREREADHTNNKDSADKSISNDQVFVVDMNGTTDTRDSPSKEVLDEGASKVVSSDNEVEVIKVVLKDDLQSKTIDTEETKDSRHVISENSLYSVVDERVVELSQSHEKGNSIDDPDKKDDDVNIYEDMQRDIELFQAEDMDI